LEEQAVSTFGASFNVEDGGSVFFRNVGIHSQNYTALKRQIPQCLVLRNIKFRRGRGIFRPAEQVLTSEQGHCSMELENEGIKALLQTV
jgi:hypothetical protein